MVGIESLTLPIVLGAAIVDSINPCAIGVLLLLVASLTQFVHDKKRMLQIGIIYVTVVFITYLLAGLGLVWFQSYLITLGVSLYVGVFIGLISIFFGFVEIKDFFWYGKGFSLQIPPKYAEEIKQKVKKVSVPGAIFLGALVAVVELPCTGGPYLAITALLAQRFDITAMIYLAVYNFIFVLPLLIILALSYFGISTKRMKAWKQSKRKWMRLALGILLVVLGLFIIGFYMRWF
ncbi:MAG: GAP family protein [Candidatus Iainarchaeum archaeon]|uniref:GAP family protein n=1 Tax=Candidatus Iainarchaeum sp. TaxID=3101447 RepID=A0A7T9DKK2_9ARCH|nr:MAG: GAP family protein [Candidatus Diapherotrites archaeon]